MPGKKQTRAAYQASRLVGALKLQTAHTLALIYSCVNVLTGKAQQAYNKIDDSYV